MFSVLNGFIKCTLATTCLALICNLGGVLCLSRGSSLQIVDRSFLGQDPQTVNRLNGESFQQDVLVMFNGHQLLDSFALGLTLFAGYQYAVFWVADALNVSIRHASVSRRPVMGDLQGLYQSRWETFTFTDYDQTDDDGHDT